MEHLCTVKDGWSGIEAALLAASPQDTISIEGGEFYGDRTLNIKSGVTLSCSPNTHLVYSGLGAAIQGLGEKNVVLSDIRISSRSVGSLRQELPWTMSLVFGQNPPTEYDPAIRTLGDKSASSGELEIANWSATSARQIFPWSPAEAKSPEWGLIFFDKCNAVTIRRLALMGQPEELNQQGVAVRKCTNAIVEACSVDGFGGSGILFFSSEKCQVEDCEVSNCKCGVVLSRSASSPLIASKIILIGNKCYDNSTAGIGLLSSEA